MSWKQEFQGRILGFLVRQGSPVAQRPSAYGWVAYDWQELYEHLRTCPVDTGRSSWEDSEWSEFDGTFAEPPWSQRHGIDAKIYCTCGKIDGRTWRYGGSHGDLLRAITED